MKETKENADLWITVITPLNRLYIFRSNSVVKKYKIAVFLISKILTVCGDFGPFWPLKTGSDRFLDSSFVTTAFALGNITVTGKKIV